MIDEVLFTGQDKLIKGPIVISPNIFEDSRGVFFESWNLVSWQKILEKHGQDSSPFVQDNHSSSSLGVLRGLHYQIQPKAQGKLVRCVVGEIFDIAVDLRIGSQTFGQWGGEILSAKNKKQLWIPIGFAHGFLTLSKTADVLYKTTDFWHKDSERSIHWNDPDLSIDWPDISSISKTMEPILSEKDGSAPFLKNLSDQEFFR